MTHRLTWLDRVRIERVVWTLDQRLYDIPRDARIAHRREVRQNLLSAAHDLGTAAALRNIGTTAQLAAAFLADAANGFAAGIAAANPHATGTYHWSGLSLLQGSVTATAVDGQTTLSGGGLSIAGWVLWIIIAVLVGRLWRAPGTWRARARPITAS